MLCHGGRGARPKPAPWWTVVQACPTHLSTPAPCVKETWTGQTRWPPGHGHSVFFSTLALWKGLMHLLRLLPGLDHGPFKGEGQHNKQPWALSGCPTRTLAFAACEPATGARASLTFSNDARGSAGASPVAEAQGCRHPTGKGHPAAPWGTAGTLSLGRAGRG